MSHYASNLAEVGGIFVNSAASRWNEAWYAGIPMLNAPINMLQALLRTSMGACSTGGCSAAASCLPTCYAKGSVSGGWPLIWVIALIEPMYWLDTSTGAAL